MSLRVLLAEDEPLVALALGDLLEDAGFAVTLASDGGDALEKAAAMATEGHPPDVLLTDLRMPRLSGEDLIRKLRTGRPSLPVVVVTGSVPPGGVEELRRHGGGDGAINLLTKPVENRLLVEAVHRAATSLRCRPALSQADTWKPPACHDPHREPCASSRSREGP